LWYSYTLPGFAGRAGQKGPEAERVQLHKNIGKDIEQQNIDLFNNSSLVGFNFNNLIFLV
jgi:hypothetical protein